MDIRNEIVDTIMLKMQNIIDELAMERLHNPKLSLRFFPDNGTITITSHATSKTSEEYISGFYRYTRR